MNRCKPRKNHIHKPDSTIDCEQCQKLYDSYAWHIG